MTQLPPFFYELFHYSIPRQGPGDDDSTRRALDLLTPHLSTAGAKPLKVIDLGCGSGQQTLALAGRIDGSILAVDNHQPFLDELMRRAGRAGVADKITTACRDMAGLSSADGPFDLAWAEGSLFVMGFTAGLKLCHDLVRPGGCVAVTELCWFRPDPPKPCREFHEGHYPVMTDVEHNLDLVRAAGLQPVDHFLLPEAAWTDNFYVPLAARTAEMRRLHGSDPEKLPVIEAVETEIENYRKHSAFFGYVFLLARRE